jgi:hypothetical protein
MGRRREFSFFAIFRADKMPIKGQTPKDWFFAGHRSCFQDNLFFNFFFADDRDLRTKLYCFMEWDVASFVVWVAPLFLISYH